MAKNNPPSFRYPFTLPNDVHASVKNALRLTYQGVVDLQQAVAALVPKVSANTTAVAATTAGATAAAASGGGSTPPAFGGVNLQPNLTPGAYTLQQSDLGGLVLVQSAIAFALTLNSSLMLPFFTTVFNLGAGLITVTPSTGLVNNTASTTLSTNQFGIFYFDGTNWWDVFPLITVPLSGTSASLGGSVMTVGQTVSVTVTVTGATTSMTATASPQTYPGDGFVWDAYVNAPDTVTVRLTCVLAGTPVASLYNVRVVE